MRQLGDKASNAPQTWHTWDEIHFLKRLGIWSPKKGDQKKPDKKILLERYLSTMEHRKNWGEIDSDEIKNFIKQELGNEGTES